MEQMITNLGFPIACVVGLSFYFVQKDKANREDVNKIIDNMREDSKEDREMYRDTIKDFSSKLDMFSSALENNTSELGNIKVDVEKIKEKVGV